MQFGHAGVALVISTYDWNPKTIIVVGLAHFLPNFDAFPIRLGLVDEDFHCSITHTLLFSIIASIAFSWLRAKYVVLAFVSLIAHFIADINPHIPCALLGFAPNFYVPDLPRTSVSHADAAVAAARDAGLTNVRIGNRHLLSRDY